MKIAILTLGTRGDVQPYAVLGRALKEKGHSVTLSTARNFESLVNSYGLDFVPVDADFQALLNTKEFDKIRKNPFLAKKHLNRFVYPMMKDAFSTFYELSGRNEKTLFHIKTMADSFADQFPGKMIKADVIPASQPTREFVNPVLSAFNFPSVMNRFSYKLTELGLKMWQKSVRDFRKKEGLPEKFVKPDLPSIYAISEYLVKKPEDYPGNIFFSGFWIDDAAGSLDADLMDFIRKGDPPILITFGSMPFQSKMNLPSVINNVISTLKLRAVVIKGWGLTDSSLLDVNPDIKVVDSAPYNVLMPLVSAVIHHGGIGTLSSCIMAGKPSLSCPVLYPMGDQHFWGLAAYKKGIALKPVPLKKLNEKFLTDNIRELITNKTIQMEARRLSDLIRSEDGVQNAISIIENI